MGGGFGGCAIQLVLNSRMEDCIKGISTIIKKNDFLINYFVNLTGNCKYYFLIKNFMIKNVLICSLLVCNLLIASDDKDKLRSKLQKEFSGITIKEMKSDNAFQFTWELIIQQLIDHNNPINGTFPQHIYLYHKSFKKPNVIVTEGYEISDRIYEPTKILDANQFSVEFRFYGHSAPEKIPWQYLNNIQALEDLHQIKIRLAKIYKKSWTATGH